MALQYLHQETYGRIVRDFASKEARDALIQSKVEWAVQIISQSKLLREVEDCKEELVKEMQYRVKSRADVDQKDFVKEQLALDDLKRIKTKFKKSNNLSKLLKQLDESCPLQSLRSDGHEISTLTMVELRKCACKISIQVQQCLL